MNVFVIYGETNQFQFCKLFDKCYTCIFQDLSSKNKTYTSVNIWKTIISFISDKGHQVFRVDHRYLTRYLPSKLIWLHLHTSRFINFMQKSERLTSTVVSSSSSRSKTSLLKKSSSPAIFNLSFALNLITWHKKVVWKFSIFTLQQNAPVSRPEFFLRTMIKSYWEKKKSW